MLSTADDRRRAEERFLQTVDTVVGRPLLEELEHGIKYKLEQAHHVVKLAEEEARRLKDWERAKFHGQTRVTLEALLATVMEVGVEAVV